MRENLVVINQARNDRRCKRVTSKPSPPFYEMENNTADRITAAAEMNKVIQASILPDRLVTASSSRYPPKERQTQRNAAMQSTRPSNPTGVKLPEAIRADRLNKPNSPSPSPAPIDIALVYTGPPFCAVRESPTNPIEPSRSTVERALISGVTPRRTRE